MEVPVPSQGHCGFPSFPVVDWFCLFVDLWVLPFPLEDCSMFGNFVITLICDWIMVFRQCSIFCLCFSFYYVHWLQRGCLCRLYVVRPVVLVVDELYIIPEHLILLPFLSGFESLVVFFLSTNVGLFGHFLWPIVFSALLLLFSNISSNCYLRFVFKCRHFFDTESFGFVMYNL